MGGRKRREREYVCACLACKTIDTEAEKRSRDKPNCLVIEFQMHTVRLMLNNVSNHHTCFRSGTSDDCDVWSGSSYC